MGTVGECSRESSAALEEGEAGDGEDGHEDNARGAEGGRIPGADGRRVGHVRALRVLVLGCAQWNHRV